MGSVGDIPMYLQGGPSLTWFGDSVGAGFQFVVCQYILHRRPGSGSSLGSQNQRAPNPPEFAQLRVSRAK